MLQMDREECENISRRVHNDQSFDIYKRLEKIEKKLAALEVGAAAKVKASVPETSEQNSKSKERSTKR